MDDERRRLATFRNWTAVDAPAPAELAYAGFYCANRDDFVRCAYCRIEIGNWSIGSDAMSDHKRYSPACRFICELIKRPVSPPATPDEDARAAEPFRGGDLLCSVCLDAQREIMFSPCHHVVCCAPCAEMVNACVVCRASVERRVKVFLH
ncbi:IAP-3 [Lymantria xylina nucleopolyhedrovirus]|uniref:IAP-3 n=1 Tax=Lymantria xylina multiple nucleopolyhedrovirus TaxID=2847840 RepID=D4N2F3_9ABAC|nr:IAP-3 [Lymantria xylina nucleopolyhedrovirus]ADD73825.1 IAP-3 [Lymantria xylina nucleopolyhedrovirus]